MQKIDFSFETEFGSFSDAIVLSDEEAAVLTEADIENIKQTRLNNWLAIVNPTPVQE